MFPAVSISIATLTAAIGLTLMRMRPNARRLQTVCMFVTGTALAFVLAGIARGWLGTLSGWLSKYLVALFGKLWPAAVPVFKGVCAALPWVIPAVLILVFLLQVDPRRGKTKGKGKSSFGGASSGGSSGLTAMTPWLGLAVPMAVIMVPWSQLGIGG